MIRNTCYLLITMLCRGVGVTAYAQDRPNILWIVSEDNSPFLGCYGDSFATTPRHDHR